MRFLADAGISRKTVDFLRLRGHDAVHVRDLLLQRAADRELVDKARADSRTLLTFDLDFGEILALGILKEPSVVIFRLADERADSVNRRLEVVLSEQSESLASGALGPDRGIAAAKAFFRKALASHTPRWPSKVTLDGHVPSRRALWLLRRDHPIWRNVQV